MPRTSLHLPQPCAESWEAMTPTKAGRHCAACQQVVVNFTEKTDAEVLAYFRRATGANVCGRLRATQLGRPLQPAAPANRWRSWLASALALGGVAGAGRAAAQSSGAFHPGPVPAAVSPSVAGAEAGAAGSVVPAAPTSAPAAPAAGAAGPLHIRGVVRDARTEEGLPGVTVLVKGTQQGISTNADGTFALELADTAEATLVLQMVGYASTELLVCGTAGETVLLQPRLEGYVLGGLVMGVSIVPPAPWRPRALYYWGRYWLMRPFR